MLACGRGQSVALLAGIGTSHLVYLLLVVPLLADAMGFANYTTRMLVLVRSIFSEVELLLVGAARRARELQRKAAPR